MTEPDTRSQPSIGHGPHPEFSLQPGGPDGFYVGTLDGDPAFVIPIEHRLLGSIFRRSRPIGTSIRTPVLAAEADPTDTTVLMWTAHHLAVVRVPNPQHHGSSRP